MLQKKWVLAVFLLLVCSLGFAQKADTLFVSYDKGRMVVPYRVSDGETLFMLARRFSVPPAVLADVNSLTYNSELKKGTLIYIPVGSYNQISSKPASGAIPFYYKVGSSDNLHRISQQAGLTQHTVQQWNNMTDNSVRLGQQLLLGWVKYDGKELPEASRSGITTTSSNGTKETVIVLPSSNQDTIPPRPLSSAEKLYLQQTNNETAVFEDKGTAVFFAMPGKVSSTATIFAFHNSAPKGTVIKVYNPGTDKTVFVKVLGPIPNNKQYHNSIIAIGNGAKVALGLTEDRSWCELKYAAY